MTRNRENLDILSARYTNLTYADRVKLLFDEFDPDKILVTTSFGSTSAVLLHMINKVKPNHPIYLINTGYLFEETLHYRDLLIRDYGLNVVDVHPAPKSHQFTSDLQVWKGNPDFCCFINKVEPMNQLKKGKDVWVSGLLRFQNANRAQKQLFEQSRDIVKFYPILDMTQEDLNLYRMIYELPTHPLLFQGYGSIGCTHCTEKGIGREGRWQGQQKTECGLHVL